MTTLDMTRAELLASIVVLAVTMFGLGLVVGVEHARRWRR